MRLSGGACALCGAATGESVLWAARVLFLRVWCCARHVDHLGELERGQLLAAAFELESQRRTAGQSQEAVNTPKA